MNNLGQLLDRAVPEPPRHLDPTDVLDAARRRRRAQASWAGVAAAGLVLAVLATSSVLTRPEADRSSLDPADGPLPLSALERRVPLSADVRGAVEVLPLQHPGEASLVATVDGYDVYLAERADGDLCLVAEHEGAAGGNCVRRSELLAEEGLTILVQEGEAQPATLIVAAPDGYDTAELGGVTARIKNNVAALPTDGPAHEVTLTGVAVPDARLDVSSWVRSEQGTPPATAQASTEAAARAALIDIARSAQRYAEDHGTMAGFADALSAEQGPAIRRQLAALTDTSAVARISAGSCLSIEFATGDLEETRC